MVRFSVALVALTAALVCQATTPGPPPSPWLAAHGQLHGDTLEVWVSYDEHRSLRWNPEKDRWPMSTQRALELARVALRKLVGKDEEYFTCFDIRLKRLFTGPNEERAPWCFIVIFESDRDALMQMEVPRGTPPTIPFVVFPDDDVKMPQKKKPNK